MKRKVLYTSLAVALGAGYALTAFSQVKPDVLVKQRQAVMTLQGKYFGPLVGMVKGAPYNAEVVARNAAYLEVLGQMPWDGFAESTKGEKSRALPADLDRRRPVQAGPGPAANRGRCAVGRLQGGQRGRREGGHRRRRQGLWQLPRQLPREVA